MVPAQKPAALNRTADVPRHYVLELPQPQLQSLYDVVELVPAKSLAPLRSFRGDEGRDFVRQPKPLAVLMSRCKSVMKIAFK